MRKKNHPGDASSLPEVNPDGTEKTQLAKEQYEYTSEQEEITSSAVTPAKLPPHSQAAVAQRLNDVPGKPIPGFIYNVPQLRQHPAGWRTKRHIKRKILRKYFMRATLSSGKVHAWYSTEPLLRSRCLWSLLSSLLPSLVLLGNAGAFWKSDCTT